MVQNTVHILIITMTTKSRHIKYTLYIKMVQNNLCTQSGYLLIYNQFSTYTMLSTQPAIIYRPNPNPIVAVQ